jgi:hypothetical protein
VSLIAVRLWWTAGGDAGRASAAPDETGTGTAPKILAFKDRWHGFTGAAGVAMFGVRGHITDMLTGRFAS